MNSIQLTISNPRMFHALKRRMDRKASRMGLQAPAYTIGAPRTEKQRVVQIGEEGSDSSSVRLCTVYDVQVQLPVTNSQWQMLAQLEHLKQGENMVYSAADADTINEAYRTAPCGCDHCKVDRYRKFTYVLKDNTTGIQKQVGSTCLQDFLGSDAASCRDIEFQSLLVLSLRRFEEGERLGGGNSGEEGMPLLSVLLHTIDAISLYGWTSKGEARKQAEQGRSILPTADIVERRLSNRPSKDDQPSWEGDSIPDAIMDEAEAVIAYWADAEGDNDYVRNCKALARMRYCTRKALGFACSMVNSMRSAKVREALKATEMLSTYIGTPGKRLKGVTVKVMRLFSFETNYGTSYISILKTPEGNILKGKSIDACEGDTVVIDASVKAHDEYKGVKQTVVQRITVTRKEEEVFAGFAGAA